MALDIIGLGEPLIEFNQDPSRTDEPIYRLGHGGDTSNVTIAATRQGARTGYITALGADSFGDSLIALWQREEVDASRVVRDPTAHTGVYFVSHGPKGHVFTYMRAGSAASRLKPENLPLDYIAGAKFLHVSGISQAISAAASDTVFAAVRHARTKGVKVSYDTNLRLKLWPLDRARAITHATVPLCDVLLPSLEDAEALTGLTDADAIADFYLKLGAPLVALKLGPEGALVATAAERRRIAGHPVKAADATGAGDTFDGSFLAMLATGQDPFEAARYANVAAALSTQGYGAVAPIPRREQVLALLKTSGSA
jgi:2-dehydro-3-deoxygluconokinase